MTDPNDGQALPADASTAIALPGVLDRPIASLSAVQAVQRIRVCVGVARSIAELMEMQVREAAWVVRREHPERDAFVRFCAEQGLGDTISPGRAWRYAEEWDLIRARRPLRELAQDRPREAISLLAAYSDTRGEATMDAVDREIHAALSEPSKRKRLAGLREIGERAMAAREDRNPADVEEIRTLTEERDAAVRELHKARGHAGGGGAEAFVLYGDLIDVQHRLLALAQAVEAWMDAGDGDSAVMRRRVEQSLEVADTIVAHGERIQDALSADSAD